MAHFQIAKKNVIANERAVANISGPTRRILFLLPGIVAGLLCRYSSSASAGQEIRATLLTDKAQYAEAETIRVTLEIENVSGKDIVLRSILPPTPYSGSFLMDNLMDSTEDRPLAELCFYAPGEIRLFFIYPIAEEPKRQVTLESGQRLTLRYEVPAFRVVLYSKYGDSCPCEVRGPWFSGGNAEIRKDLVVIPEYKPVTCRQPYELFDEAFVQKYLRSNVIKTFYGGGVYEAGKYRPAGLVDPCPEDSNELSQLEPVRLFAEKHGRFDGLFFTHVYITGGDFYGERIVILSSLGPAIETLLVRTWQGIPDCDPRVVEVFDLHSEQVNQPSAERFKVEHKPPLDFGWTKVYDTLSGELIFSAGSVWMGTGGIGFPRSVGREEIQQLHAEQSRIRKETSKYLGADLRGPLSEVEGFLHKNNLRIRAVNDFRHNGEGPVSLALTIPPNAVRADVVATLKQNANIRVSGE